MPTIRHHSAPPERGYTIIPNWLIRDSTVPPNAKAAIILLLSHEDGWDTDVSAVGKALGIGRDATQRALNALQQKRLLTRVPMKDDDNVVRRWEWVVTVPSEPPYGKPVSGSEGATLLETQNLAFPEGGSTTPHKKTNDKKTNDKKTIHHFTSADAKATGDLPQPRRGHHSDGHPRADEPYRLTDDRRATLVSAMTTINSALSELDGPTFDIRAEVVYLTRLTWSDGENRTATIHGLEAMANQALDGRDVDLVNALYDRLPEGPALIEANDD